MSGNCWCMMPTGGPVSIPPGMGDGAGLARRSSVAAAGFTRPTAPTAPTTAAAAPVPTSSRRRPIRRGAPYWRPSIPLPLLFILHLLCPYGFRLQQDGPFCLVQSSDGPSSNEYCSSSPPPCLSWVQSSASFPHDAHTVSLAACMEERYVF